MDRKTIVPDGMLKAAEEAFMAAPNGVYHENPIVVHILKNQLPVALEAALLWQKTQSPKPTEQQALELRNLALAVNRNYNATDPTAASCVAVAVDWVGRMYDAPEKKEVKTPQHILDLRQIRYDLSERPDKTSIKLVVESIESVLLALGDAPHDPEVPEEIKGLFWYNVNGAESHNNDLIEVYRLCMKAKDTL